MVKRFVAMLELMLLAAIQDSGMSSDWVFTIKYKTYDSENNHWYTYYGVVRGQYLQLINMFVSDEDYAPQLSLVAVHQDTNRDIQCTSYQFGIKTKPQHL